jgi:hypothetical protein
MERASRGIRTRSRQEETRENRNHWIGKHRRHGGSALLRGGARHPIFVAGDDQEAKAVVSRLITDIGFAPVDTGSLAQGGRRQQPGSHIYNEPMTAAQAQKFLSVG